jgi:hypothetical protein
MKSARQLCISILIVNAIAALIGGYMLINDATGHSLQLNLDDLKGSPFTDYSTAGWILLIVLGAFSIVAAVISFLHHKLYPYFIMAEGALLLLFIIAEIYLIQQLQVLQIVFGLMAIALLLLGNLIRKNTPLSHHHVADSSASSGNHPKKKSHYHKHRKRGH